MPESLGCERFVTLNKAHVLTAKKASHRERECVVYWYSFLLFFFLMTSRLPGVGLLDGH